MVDIQSVAASSHLSRRERESEREATSRSRAGRSRQAGGRTDATIVVLESQLQRTSGTTASPPTAAGIDAALLVVRQLLNNPPPSGASPSAAEQWCHDIDQLIIIAINMPHREMRHLPSVQQSHVPSAVRAPSVAQAPSVLPNVRPSMQHRAPMASYMMMDLREEINRCRGGEDSHTAIERHRERRRDIEGRNLEKDFDLHALVRGGLDAHAPLPPNSPGVSEGVHGTSPSPVYGDLAAQVSAPPAREVRRDGQPHWVPTYQLHLHPHCRWE
jgi:hypothetical protein